MRGFNARLPALKFRRTGIDAPLPSTKIHSICFACVPRPRDPDGNGFGVIARTRSRTRTGWQRARTDPPGIGTCLGLFPGSEECGCGARDAGEGCSEAGAGALQVSELGARR